MIFGYIFFIMLRYLISILRCEKIFLTKLFELRCLVLILRCEKYIFFKNLPWVGDRDGTCHEWETRHKWECYKYTHKQTTDCFLHAHFILQKITPVRSTIYNIQIELNTPHKISKLCKTRSVKHYIQHVQENASLLKMKYI